MMKKTGGRRQEGRVQKNGYIKKKTSREQERTILFSKKKKISKTPKKPGG